MSENMDFCEYVYNPLMRQYQAMMRLMQMLSNSEVQAECNDIECFAPNDQNSPTNVLNSVGGGPSAFSTYMPMMMIWAAFVMMLYFLRPNSMRKKQPQIKAASPNNSNVNRRPRFHEHDDDDAFAN